MLEIRNITKKYKDTYALKGVTFSLDKEVVGLMGVNGAGKTTLIKILTTLLKQDTGEIIYDGERIDKIEKNYLSKLGYMPQYACYYDDFSVNSVMNRIIKSTVLILLKGDISKSRKKELRKLMVFFDDVDVIDLYSVNWNMQYNRNNQTYRMLISICYLVFKGLLQTQSDGTTKLMDFLDEQRMHRLYEKFILEYYRKDYSSYKIE